MIWRFGVYEVDTQRVEIRRSGVPVAVQPQVFSVIEFLIAHRDRVVTKEDLLDGVWGDRFVSESALTSRIKTARRALGDSGSTQRVIRTVQGRGYRFVADVTIGDVPLEEARASDEPLGEPPDTERPSVDAALGEWPLLGRRNELEAVQRFFADPSVGGVLITGPTGIGANRFADECQARAESQGIPIARIIGLASASEIPLAVISHLLPADVLATGQSAQDLARAEVHRRARTAIEEFAGGRRALVVIQNAHHLDPMTSTLLATLMFGSVIFGVAVRSRLSTTTGDGSGRVVLFRELALPPLDEVDVDILLHRALGGPIARPALRDLFEMSSGRPGLLIDIVESSRAAGALQCEDGVWRVTGPLTSSMARTWDPERLSERAVHAAEVLALLGRVPEAAAVDLVGDAALEELDEHRLVGLYGYDETAMVSLADPLLAVAVRTSMAPLRERRLKREIARKLLREGTDPATLSTIVQWVDYGDPPIDRALLVTAAQTAMIAGDLATAGLLSEYLAPTGDPNAQLVNAEVTLRRGQWRRAETLFDSIDGEQLDEISATHVLRRRAAIQFYSRGRYQETIDWLAAEAEARSDRARRSLLARRTAMFAFLGRVDDTLRAAAELDGLRGLNAMEVTMSRAAAHLHAGEFRRTISLLDEVDRLLADLPIAWADEPRDAYVTLRCSSLFHLGEIVEATTLIQQHLPVGRRTRLGFLPSLAGLLQLYAGRPRAAREYARQVIESSHRSEFPQYAHIAEAIFAVTDVALGRSPQAAIGLKSVRQSLDVASGELRWMSSILIAHLAAGLGEPFDPTDLLESASEAQAFGASMREADLIATAALLDVSGDIARAQTDRLVSLAQRFDGRLWPIRSAHVTALAEGADLTPFKQAYHDLGFDGLMTLAGA